MYVSRLAFHTLPGHTEDVTAALRRLADMVASAGGERPRILRTHYASLGAPDVVFEQQAADLVTLESQIEQVAGSGDFQRWSDEMSQHLAQSPKRELYLAL